MAKKYDRLNEQVVLASVLRDTDARARALACIRPRDFFGDRHRAIFAAVQKCVDLSLEPDDENVAVQAAGETGGVGYLRKLRKLNPASRIEHNLDMLRRDAARARAAEAAAAFADVARDPDAEYDEVVSAAVAAREELRVRPLDAPGRGWGDEWLQRYAARRESGESLFVPTTYAPLDDLLTEGLAPGSMTVVGGRPRMGKTMFCVDLVRRLIVGTDLRVAFVALEKGAEYATNLLISSVSGVNKNTLIKTPGELSDKQDAKIRRAKKRLFDGGRLVVFGNPVRRLVRSGGWTNEAAMGAMGELLASVSAHVWIWDIWQRALPVAHPEAVTAALDAFYELNAAADAHSVVVQQIHRRAEDRRYDKARRPTLVDLKQSGAYEEYGDTVLLVHREKVHKEFMPRGDVMEVNLAKQKLGECGAGIGMAAEFRPLVGRLRNERPLAEGGGRGGARFADDGG